MTTDNGAEKQADEDRVPTERVILQHVSVIKLPGGGVERETLEKVIALLGLKGPSGKPAKPEQVMGEAWLEVSRQTALTKRAAIELYAGEPGTPDAKEGTFRAPPLRSWKDALRFEAPPKPLVQVSVVD